MSNTNYFIVPKYYYYGSGNPGSVEKTCKIGVEK